MALEIVKPGLQATVQDEGRVGLYAHGMPPAGALDKHAYRIGNALVGNPAGAAGIEMTYLGAEVVFSAPVVFAVTGAEMAPKLDDEEIETWRSYRAAAGQRLSFGYLTAGARSYLAVAGGIDIAPYEGSRSTYTLVGRGGFEGRPLAAGDVLPVAGAVDGTPDRRVPEDLRPSYEGDVEARVVTGLASYRLEPESLRALFETSWKVTPNANRVGYRYSGGELRFVEREQPVGAGSDPSNVVDFGYPVGSIQVPGGIEPICLLNDAVTAGGYATVGTVISCDLDRIAQSQIGQATHFVEVGIDEALAARRARRAELESIVETISNGRRSEA
ncbi:MAG TPA: biotin-dependent carboxyltransferase family protein [Solirubrobacterales bacterium]|jgi:biotin-dependent carboxylase-like uncharacterized protein